MTHNDSSFIDPQEALFGDDFCRKGYLIQPVENRDSLQRIHQEIARIAADKLGLPVPDDAKGFLDSIGRHVSPSSLNDFRLAIIQGMNAAPWLRPAYYSLVRSALDKVVGNELAMQMRINLSIQLPNDDTSLLPAHGDVWSGDSPFEVVVWLPLVDCMGTKCMYLLPPEHDARVQANLSSYQGKTVEDLYKDFEQDAQFMDLRFGEIMIFNQNLIHGNRINVEETTRWSMNCRFKSVFSPYSDKKLGEFFEPISLRPATRIGLDYTLPGGFDDDA